MSIRWITVKVSSPQVSTDRIIAVSRLSASHNGDLVVEQILSVRFARRSAAVASVAVEPSIGASSCRRQSLRDSGRRVSPDARASALAKAAQRPPVPSACVVACFRTPAVGRQVASFRALRRGIRYTAPQLSITGHARIALTCPRFRECAARGRVD